MTILYITQNGITTHIGRSQVAPYLLGLAQAGFNITLLSCEPNGNKSLVEQYKVLFDGVGIRWVRVPYSNTPAIIGPLLTQFRLLKAAKSIVCNSNISVVHCRSHPTALIGYELKHRYGVKFIFDFRDFYADWGIQNTRGVKRLIYQRIKKLEGPMVQTADKVICLTYRARTLLSDIYFDESEMSLPRFQVVPCCADFAHFDLSKVSVESVESLRLRLKIPLDAFVLIYLGSLGTDYLLGNMIKLFKQLLKIKPNAHFLFVSNNGDNLVRKECRFYEVPFDRIRITTAPRETIPLHLALANLSVVFIRADHTKVGCSPTKLAELFACNVPVIANSGVGDLDTIIDPLINRSVLVSDFSDEAMLSALEKSMAYSNGSYKLINIRENSRIFSLEEGISSYTKVYRTLL